MTDKEYNYKNSHIASKVKFKLNTIKYNGIYTIHFNITDLIIKFIISFQMESGRHLKLLVYRVLVYSIVQVLKHTVTAHQENNI